MHYLKTWHLILAAIISLIMLAFLTTRSAAEEPEIQTIGGDVYMAGEDAELKSAAPRDVFLAGLLVDAEADIAGDTHMAGFSIGSYGALAGDLYAAGFTATVRGDIGSDASIAAFSIDVAKGASIGGNARLAGRKIRVSGPIEGTLTAAADTLTISAPISGDVVFRGRKLVFEDGARVGGTLNYQAASPAEIPPDVIAPGKTIFKVLTLPRPGAGWTQRDWDADDESTWLAALFGWLVFLLFLIGVGALALALAPGRVEDLRDHALSRPWQTLFIGIAGLAILIGLIPITAMTLLGIPLVPFVVAALALLWILGYVLGAYSAAWRVKVAFGNPPDTLTARISVLAAGLAALSLINFVPFVGWIANLAAVFLGLGSITAAVLGKMMPSHTLSAQTSEQAQEEAEA